MVTLKLHVVLVVIVTFATDVGFGCRRSSASIPTPGPTTSLRQNNVYNCGICDQPITVDLIIRNKLQAPQFEYHVTVEPQPQRELIHFLEAAATQDPHYKFTAEYHGSLGYMITTINKLSASVANKTYWSIIEDPSGNSLDLGVSSYVPVDFKTLTFNFTTWS
jgi:hypothetical protein